MAQLKYWYNELNTLSVCENELLNVHHSNSFLASKLY